MITRFSSVMPPPFRTCTPDRSPSPSTPPDPRPRLQFRPMHRPITTFSDLLQQRIDPVILALLAPPVQHFPAYRAIVEITVKSHQVSLDLPAQPLAKRLHPPDAHRRGIGFAVDRAAPGVNPLGRRHLLAAIQVRGRHADRPPALVTLHHHALKYVRPPQANRRVPHAPVP